MTKPVFLFFHLLLLLFCGCREQVKKKTIIHQIRFGSLDGNPAENSKNNGFRFSRFMQIDLNTDSILLKVNQTSLEEFKNGKKPATYFTGNISPLLKNDLIRFQAYVLQKKNGPKYETDPEFPALYCGPLIFLEYKKDTAVRYFYLKHSPSISYDSSLTELSKRLYNFTSESKYLKPAKVIYNLNDDSLIAPIVTRSDFKENAPPPPVRRTIIFTPPVEFTKQQ